MGLPLHWPPSVRALGCTSGGTDPGFPETSSTAVRRRTMLDFAGFGRVIAAEMDVDDLLRHGADPVLDGP